MANVGRNYKLKHELSKRLLDNIDKIKAKFKNENSFSVAGEWEWLEYSQEGKELTVWDKDCPYNQIVVVL